MKNSPRMKKNTWWSRQVSSNGTCKRSWSLWSLCSWSQVKRLKTYCQFSEEEKAYWIAISSMKAMSIVATIIAILINLRVNSITSSVNYYFIQKTITKGQQKDLKNSKVEMQKSCKNPQEFVWDFHLKKRNLRVFSNEQKVRSKSCLAQNAKVRFLFTWRGLNE